jgi:hypothetical protein
MFQGGEEISMRIFILLMLGLLSGCATSHSVMVADVTAHPAPKTVALAPEDGNSEKMDKLVTDELKANALDVKAKLAIGTRKSPDVDLVVSYVDHWFWDMAMYLRSLDVNIYNATTGNLLVQGHWQDSAMHGFRDPAQVLHEVVPDMLSRLKTTPSEDKTAAPK